MATLKVEPVETQSKGGFPVTISGIAPTEHNCIVGEITTPGAGTKAQVWNLDGRAGNSVPDCDLDMSDDELFKLAELARKLGAPGA